MKTYSQLKIELYERDQQQELPFDRTIHHGWHEDGDHVILYHGTHKKHLHSILKNGLTHPDPKTGMISLTPDPHTAHGYAAMSGEANFRAAGKKAVHVPHEDRAVVKFRVPKHWLNQHKDSTLSGNIGIAKKRLTDKSEYDKWQKDNGKDRDHEYYQTSEFRVKHPVPAHFITGYMHKKK